MDSSAFGRDLGGLFKSLFVLSIIGIVALVVGLGWLLWMAFVAGGWWAHAACFFAGWAAHAWACVLSGES